LKSTGILRRIDELGRIVIPKEIRRNLRIRDGESLEIFTEENKIVLKKVSMMEDISTISQICCDSMYEVIKKNIIITDRDNIIAVSEPLKKRFLNKEISTFLENAISRRDNYVEKYKKEIEIVSDQKEECNYALSSIIVNGDAIGLVIILSESDINEIDEKVANLISRFLSKQIE
jgi:AbrB family transcriptional regulator (stage V sporulation protein T)